TIYESMPDRVERVDHLGIDAPQLHPAGCTLWSLSPVRGLHLPDLQLKKPGGKWGQFPVLAGVGGWFMHGGSWLAPCIGVWRQSPRLPVRQILPQLSGGTGA
ncbi:TPA: hypothetical protein L7154_003905, partial [Escherichia coli]|nr:hypothetical protein [Escherichia coli]HAX4977116.1 hypothetical protein [Escherichia coli]HAX5037152.1 hypothetical protein [Escherichia coli]HBQ4150326.1 hypothetical protein [Escherichia coli]